MTKAELQTITTKLASLGEDKDELELWLSIYDSLEPDEQKELFTNLQDELKKLEKLSPKL